MEGAATGVSKPNDGFARVTWTDLAMGKNAYGHNNNDSRDIRSLRPGSSGGRKSIISPEVATFSLANQDKTIDEEYEETKVEGVDNRDEQVDD